MSDRERDRDRDRGQFSSSYVPSQRERDERSRKMYNDGPSRMSPEEGQIIPLPRRPAREWEVERDPRIPPTVGSARDAGPSRRRARSRSSSRGRSRSRSRSPEYSSKEVAAALNSFTRCMHSTLLGTTDQALAARHVERLESFPPAQVNPDTLSDARKRLHEAESRLSDQMRSLHSAFGEMMRRTTPSRRTAGRDSRSFEDRQDVQRMIRDKVDFSELVSVRRRLEGVERQLDEGVRDKGKGKERERETDPNPPPPATTTGTEPPPAEGTDGKRIRARELLEDMLRRLEKVEGMKDHLENRYFDIQDQLNAKEQEELEVLRLGNGRWKMIERLRDPDGVIRGAGVKRRRLDADADADVGKDKEKESEVGMELDRDQESGKDDDVHGTVTFTLDGKEVRSDFTNKPTTSDATVSELRERVESLQKELAAVKESQAEREKAIVEQVTATIQSQLEGMVRSRIMKAVDLVKVQGAKASQRPMTSPAMPSPSFPTIPQNAVLPSPTPAQQPGNSAPRPSSSSAPPQSVPQARSTSNPQPRSADVSPRIQQQQQPQPSPSLATPPPPRPASHPVAESSAAASQQPGQAPSDRSRLRIDIGPPPDFGRSDRPVYPQPPPPTPPQSAPPTSQPASNPLNRLIDPRLQPHPSPQYSNYPQPPAQGLGMHPGPPPNSLPPDHSQLMAFQNLVNQGHNGVHRLQASTSQGEAGQGNGSLLQKMSNVLGAQNQAPYQGDNGGFQAWSVYPPPG